MKKTTPKATKTVYPIICQIVNVIPHQFIVGFSTVSLGLYPEAKKTKLLLRSFCLRLAALDLRLMRGGVRFLHRLAAGKLDAAAVIHAQALHEHLVADLANGLDVRDTLVAGFHYLL